MAVIYERAKKPGRASVEVKAGTEKAKSKTEKAKAESKGKGKGKDTKEGKDNA